MPTKQRVKVTRNQLIPWKVITTISYTGSPSTTSTWQDPYNLGIQGGDEKIEYSNGRDRFNPCYHVKKTWEDIPFSYVLGYFPSGGSRRTEEYQSELYGPAKALMDAGPVEPTLDMFQFSVRAWQAVRPKLVADLSVPNFIIELRDIKKMVPNLEQARLLISALKSQKRGGARLGKSLSNVSKVIAEQHLNLSFGIGPFINDCFNMIVALNEFNLKLDAFRKNAGRWHVAHYKEESDSSGSKLVTPYHKAPQWDMRIEYEVLEYLAAATISYRYRVRLGKFHIPSLFMKYIGFRGNPAILWEAIPFSFLVDWVFTIQKTLEAFDEGAVPVDVEIQRVGLSLKYKAERNKLVTGLTYLNGGWSAIQTNTLGANILTGKATFEVFRRWELNSYTVGQLLAVAPLPQIQPPTGSQLMLGGSLAITGSTRR